MDEASDYTVHTIGSGISSAFYFIARRSLIPGPLFSWLAPARNYWGTIDQGSGQVVCVSLAIILLAFAGASPVKIYSFEWR